MPASSNSKSGSTQPPRAAKHLLSPRRNRVFLGIEIGGTKLQLGVGTGDGPPFAGFRRLDVDAARGAQGILQQIERTGRELAAEYPLQAIAFGFGGPING